MANSQIPAAGQLTLDHVAHFVPDIERASEALARLGFTLTPFSAQSHRLEAGGPLLPAGTGNRCVMLGSGYLEILTPTGDTPVANQLRAAIRRYIGVQLIALGTASPDLDHARLAKAGFDPLPPVALERTISTPSGTDIARFTVVRVPPGTMAEGRIQFCRHHTPDLVWQPRWLDHANRARALAGVLVCVDDPQEAARRYAKFTGLPPQMSGSVWRIQTARGYLLFIDAERCRRYFGAQPPAMPWIAGYVLASDDPATTRSVIRGTGLDLYELDAGRFFAEPQPEIGGVIVFEPECCGELRFD